MFPAEFNFPTTAVVVTVILGNVTLPTRLVDPVTFKLPAMDKFVRLPTVVIVGCAAVPIVPTMLAPVLPIVPALIVAAVNSNVVV